MKKNQAAAAAAPNASIINWFYVGVYSLSMVFGFPMKSILLIAQKYAKKGFGFLSITKTSPVNK